MGLCVVSSAINISNGLLQVHTHIYHIVGIHNKLVRFTEFDTLTNKTK